MTETDQHIKLVSKHYDRLAANGPYGTLAPHNRGGRKSQYVAAVFDAALLASFEALRVGRILDFGCGTGIFTRKCAAFADEAIGMDISSGMLEQAAKVCQGFANVRLLRTDGAYIALPENYIDVVVTREVLCYVPDAQLPAMLAEIRRVTKPGGNFLWLEQVSDNPRWQHRPSAPNLVKRSSNTIRTLAESAGWQVSDHYIVRTPRFPWIYPVWLGFVPKRLIPELARWEVSLHAHRPKPIVARRWWNTLFELRNPDHG